MSFDPYYSLFASKLQALIEQRRAEVVANVAYARGVSDFATYQRLVGHIAALDECLGMFEAVSNTIREEEGR